MLTFDEFRDDSSADDASGWLCFYRRLLLRSLQRDTCVATCWPVGATTNPTPHEEMSSDWISSQIVPLTFSCFYTLTKVSIHFVENVRVRRGEEGWGVVRGEALSWYYSDKSPLSSGRILNWTMGQSEKGALLVCVCVCVCVCVLKFLSLHFLSSLISYINI